MSNSFSNTQTIVGRLIALILLLFVLSFSEKPSERQSPSNECQLECVVEFNNSAVLVSPSSIPKGIHFVAELDLITSFLDVKRHNIVSNDLFNQTIKIRKLSYFSFFPKLIRVKLPFPKLSISLNEALFMIS